jgi:hypothetical protein
VLLGESLDELVLGELPGEVEGDDEEVVLEPPIELEAPLEPKLLVLDGGVLKLLVLL